MPGSTRINAQFHADHHDCWRIVATLSDRLGPTTGQNGRINPDRPGSTVLIRPPGADQHHVHADRHVWATLINIILILRQGHRATPSPHPPPHPPQNFMRGGVCPVFHGLVSVRVPFRILWGGGGTEERSEGREVPFTTTMHGAPAARFPRLQI